MAQDQRKKTLLTAITTGAAPRSQAQKFRDSQNPGCYGLFMSEFRGKVSLREVDKKTVEIPATKAESWVVELLKEAAPSEELTGLSAEIWAERAEYSGQAKLEKVGSEYMVYGDFAAKVPAPCSRCGDLFTTERKGDFRLFLKLSDEAEAFSDDPDYVFFDSDQINLVDILAEQLIVQEPVAECPAKKDDGSCNLCGKNPQYSGHAEKNRAGSTLSAQLERLKGRL